MPIRNSLLCSVCRKPGARGSHSSHRGISSWSELSTDDERDRVVLRIMREIFTNGSFSVGGLETFWEKFEDELCPSCRSNLDLISKKKKKAQELLEEAIELDSTNDAARQNMRILEKMI